MSFKPYTEKLRRKKLELESIITETDPRIRIRIKMIRIRNTACRTRPPSEENSSARSQLGLNATLEENIPGEESHNWSY